MNQPPLQPSPFHVVLAGRLLLVLALVAMVLGAANAYTPVEALGFCPGGSEVLRWDLPTWPGPDTSEGQPVALGTYSEEGRFSWRATCPPGPGPCWQGVGSVTAFPDGPIRHYLHLNRDSGWPGAPPLVWGMGPITCLDLAIAPTGSFVLIWSHDRHRYEYEGPDARVWAWREGSVLTITYWRLDASEPLEAGQFRINLPTTNIKVLPLFPRRAQIH